MGEKVNTDGLTSRWAVARQHKVGIEEMLVLTAVRVPKHANLLKQFMAWCTDHGATWSWKDSDRAMQHLRIMIRSLQSASLPPGKPPKGYDDLQPLIDRFIYVRSDDKDDVSLIPPRATTPAAQVHITSDDETP